MSDLPFYGEIAMLPFSYAPRDYAYCSGQDMSIAQFTALYSIIGITFGGDGQTTFRLPNLQGRTPVHPAQGNRMMTWPELGEAGGGTMVTLSESQIPAHTHIMTVFGELNPMTEFDENKTLGLAYPTASKDYGVALYTTTPTGEEETVFADEAITYTGGGQAHENRQPWLAIDFFMAMEGEYPSRP